MMKKNRNTYLAPSVKVVKFVVERGFGDSVTTTTNSDVFGENLMGQYKEKQSWTGSFTTNGENTNHF